MDLDAQEHLKNFNTSKTRKSQESEYLQPAIGSPVNGTIKISNYKGEILMDFFVLPLRILTTALGSVLILKKCHNAIYPN